MGIGETKIRKSVLAFLWLVGFYSLGYGIFYYIIGFKLLVIFTGMLVLLNWSWLWLIRKFNDEEIKLTASFYFNVMTILLFPIVIANIKEGVITVLLYYAIIPIGVLCFYSLQRTIRWTIYIVLLIVVSVVTSYLLEYDFIFPEIYKTIASYIDIFIFISILLFFYIYFFRYIMLRKDFIQTSDNQELNEEKAALLSEENRKKLKKLYDEIIDYFEKSQPYTSSDFRISLLADTLNTNATYISNAISSFSDLSFNGLVNKYRVEYAKQMMREGYLEKYSMIHIYTKSGFKYQSTFNEIFKKSEGITPREYVKNLQ